VKELGEGRFTGRPSPSQPEGANGTNFFCLPLCLLTPFEAELANLST